MAQLIPLDERATDKSWEKMEIRAIPSIWQHVYAALFAFLVVVPVLYMVGDRDTVVEVVNARIVPHNIVAGGEVEVTWMANELRTDCGGEVHRTVIDSKGKRFPYPVFSVVDRDDSDKQAKPQEFSRLIKLPAKMAPGPFVMSVVVYRWCNPIQKFFWPMVDPMPPMAGYVHATQEEAERAEAIRKKSNGAAPF